MRSIVKYVNCAFLHVWLLQTLQRYLEVSGGRRGRGRGRGGRFNQRQGSFRRFSPPQEPLPEQVSILL